MQKYPWFVGRSCGESSINLFFLIVLTLGYCTVLALNDSNDLVLSLAERNALDQVSQQNKTLCLEYNCSWNNFVVNSANIFIAQIASDKFSTGKVYEN